METLTNMPNLKHVAAAVFGQPWAILPDKLAAIAALVQFHMDGGRYTTEEIQARIGAATSPAVRQSGAIGVIPVYGVIGQRMNMMAQMSGGTSTDSLTQTFRQMMADPGCSAIVFDVDSPGGSVYGIQELADEIFKARGTKPIVAVANSIAASAAYWIASACDEVVVTPSGEVGSIGVIAQVEDDSRAQDAAGITIETFSAGKYKAESHTTPLSDDARAYLQDRVDQYYDAFTGAVAKYRGATKAAVKSGYGEGRMVTAAQSVQTGLADRVATLDQTLARLGSPRGLGAARSRPVAEEGIVSINAWEDSNGNDDHGRGAGSGGRAGAAASATHDAAQNPGSAEAHDAAAQAHRDTANPTTHNTSPAAAKSAHAHEVAAHTLREHPTDPQWRKNAADAHEKAAQSYSSPKESGLRADHTAIAAHFRDGAAKAEDASTPLATAIETPREDSTGNDRTLELRQRRLRLNSN